MVGLPAAPGYVDQLSELPHQPDAALVFLLRQIQALTAAWVALWGSRPGALIAILAVTPGLWIRLRENRPDAWYIPAYLAMLLAWPCPEHMSRFVWPLMPAFLIAAHSTLRRLGSNNGWITWATVTFATVFAFSAPAGIGRTLARLAEPPAGPLAKLSRMHEWTRAVNRKPA